MSFKMSISIKGVIIIDDNVLLLKNERDEWELPGGRLEKNEQPEICVQRETEEELGIKCEVINMIDSWVYEVFAGKFVFIVTYFLYCNDLSKIKISEEHVAYKWFHLDEIENIFMPKGYKQSINKAQQLMKESI
ncbi:NUDIX hydrolase [Lederbergia lenta]|uniref:NUDIX hydrolase n=1 Tax=Lederbergia lenta TaxID=1467 RepID=UPI0008259728|nr:NUDIX hydrolase [Lederbergia lenta]MCM3109553.1 NUDIX hydrolase [Lederbergia lenta]MEC2324693.1 NUDIX hydrolase [Lederbergia lenta]